MRGYCPTHAGRSPFLGPPKLSLNWAFDTDFDVQTQPAIDADGTVYFGSDRNRLHALTPKGIVKWEVDVGGDVKSSPAIGANGLIYFGSDDSRIYAVNRAGQIQHSYNTGSFVRSSPVIASDGTVFVGSDDNALYALSPTLTLVRRWLTGGDVRSSPAIGQNGIVYVGSDDDRVYAFNRASAIPVWTFRTGADVKSSPAVGRNGTVYVGSDDDKLYALNGATGAMRWSFDTTLDIESSPAIGPDGTIFVGSENDRLYALEDRGSSVAVKWSTHLGNDVFSSPAVGADGTVYVGSDDNKVFALRGTSGEILWSFETSGDVRSGPALGPNRNLYFGSEDDRLYAIGPKSRQECRASLFDPNATGDPLTLDAQIGRIQCDGAPYCEAFLVGSSNFDMRSAALRYMAQSFGTQEHLALTRDRLRKRNAALKDPALLAAYCQGDADRDFVPDDRDVCPNTPDMTVTDDRGCTDTRLPDAPSRKTVDFILSSLGVYYDPNCNNAPIPKTPLPTGWCEWVDPGPPLSGHYTISFRGSDNQPAGCPVWYQFRLKVERVDLPPGASVREPGFAIGPNDLGTRVTIPPGGPGGPGDLVFDVPQAHVLIHEVKSLISIRAVNGAGMRSNWSPGVEFDPRFCRL